MSLEYTYADPPLRTKKEPRQSERSDAANWALTLMLLVAIIALCLAVRSVGSLVGDLKDNTAEQRKATAEQKAAADQAMQINGKLNEFFARTEREKKP